MCKRWGFAFLLTGFLFVFFLSSHGLQPFKVYNLQKLKQNTNKNISLTTSESQILINSSILPVAAKVHPPAFPSCGVEQSPSQGWPLPAVPGLCRATVRQGGFGCTEPPSGMTLWWTETWTHVTNQGSVVQSDLMLGLLPGSRAKTDAWLFSAMLFPFCLAGSQEEQGLECEPFRGRTKRPPPPVVALLVGGRQVLPSLGRWAWDIPGALAGLPGTV